MAPEKSVRWGILGTGFIAGKFTEALLAAPSAEVVAVGSRTQASADAFGLRFNIPRRHASYAALAADPGVDAIYIATPHALHQENSILCLNAGKAVLCEKPFTINAAQSEEVFAVARAKNLLIMEALWTRFLPSVLQVEKWIAEGKIGDVRLVHAAFGFRADDAPLFDPALGGGSLLDVGVYPITIADLAFGVAPDRMVSLAHLGRSGVDEQAAIVLGYPNGGLATLITAIRTCTPYTAEIMGTEGRITIGDPFWCATQVTLTPPEGDPTTVETPLLCNGYEYQALAFMEAYRAGNTECPRMPWAKTLEFMRLMDGLRADWGLRYPMETAD